MPEIVVEQSFDPPLNAEAFAEKLHRLAPFLETGGIEQRMAVLGPEGRSAISTFLASGDKAVRNAFRAAEEPFDSVWEGEDDGPSEGTDIAEGPFAANTVLVTVPGHGPLGESGSAGRRRAFSLLLGLFLFLAFGFFLVYQSRQPVPREIPKPIPAWIPLYPDAQAEASVALPGRGEKRRSAVLYAHGLPERVTGFYDKELRARGFRVDPVRVHAQVWHLEARGPAGRELTVESGAGQGFTWIDLDYADGR